MLAVGKEHDESQPASSRKLLGGSTIPYRWLFPGTWNVLSSLTFARRGGLGHDSGESWPSLHYGSLSSLLPLPHQTLLPFNSAHSPATQLQKLLSWTSFLLDTPSNSLFSSTSISTSSWQHADPTAILKLSPSTWGAPIMPANCLAVGPHPQFLFSLLIKCVDSSEGPYK